jgi:hypothetical protein
MSIEWEEDGRAFEAVFTDADGHMLDGPEGAAWGEVWERWPDGAERRHYLTFELGERVEFTSSNQLIERRSP